MKQAFAHYSSDKLKLRNQSVCRLTVTCCCEETEKAFLTHFFPSTEEVQEGLGGAEPHQMCGNREDWRWEYPLPEQVPVPGKTKTRSAAAFC